MAIIIFGKTASGKSRMRLTELITSLLPMMNLKSLLIQDILQSGRNMTQ